MHRNTKFYPVRRFSYNQSSFNCSKSTMETSDQNNFWNLFKFDNKDARTKLLTLFWCFHCWLWASFTPCSDVSIAEFKQLNAGFLEPEQRKSKSNCMYIFIFIPCTRIGRSARTQYFGVFYIVASTKEAWKRRSTIFKLVY